MKTTNEEFLSQLTALESQVTVLETQALARGLAVPQRPDVAIAKQPSATLDEIFAAMGMVESHAAKLRTTTRLSTPLAYAPRANVAQSRSVKSVKDQLLDGDVTAAQIGKASEIHRVEGILATTKPVTTTHAALTTKIANLRAEWERLPKPTPKE